MPPRFTASREAEFSAAHFLREYHGACERLHGHNYRVRVVASCDELDSEGMVVDFSRLRDALAGVLSRFDHALINDVPPFEALNPTAEHLARYIAEEVAREVDDGRARIVECRVWETARNCAAYRR